MWNVNITLTNTSEGQFTHNKLRTFYQPKGSVSCCLERQSTCQTNIDSIASCVFSESRGSVRSRHRDGRRGVRGQPGVSRGLSHQLRLQSQEAARLTAPGLDLGRLRRQHRVRLQVRLVYSPGVAGWPRLQIVR